MVRQEQGTRDNEEQQQLLWEGWRCPSGHTHTFWKFGKLGKAAELAEAPWLQGCRGCPRRGGWPLAAPHSLPGDSVLIAHKTPAIVCSWSRALCAQHLPQAEIFALLSAKIVELVLVHLKGKNKSHIKQGMLGGKNRKPISLIVIPNETETAISSLPTN